MAASVKSWKEVIEGLSEADVKMVLSTFKMACRVGIIYFGYKKSSELLKALDEVVETFKEENKRCRAVEISKRDLLVWIGQSLSKLKDQNHASPNGLRLASPGPPSWFAILTDLNEAAVGGGNKNSSDSAYEIHRKLRAIMVREIIPMYIAKGIEKETTYNRLQELFIFKLLT